MTILDTAQGTLSCFVCALPIDPSEDQIVVGTGRSVFPLHGKCYSSGEKIASVKAEIELLKKRHCAL